MASMPRWPNFLSIARQVALFRAISFVLSSREACLGQVLDRHASTVYISSRASWASRRRSIRIGRLAASSSRRGSRGGRPLQDGVFYRWSFGFDR